MAIFATFAPKVLSVEGGYVVDQGGPTNKGITLNTWLIHGHDKNGDGKITVEDLKLISDNEALYIYKKQYWDYFNADQIKNQSIANIIVDWGVNSGQGTAAQKVNAILGISSKRFGANSIQKVNGANQSQLHALIWNARKEFYYYLAFQHPDLKKRAEYRDDYNGWLNRLARFVFVPTNGSYTPDYINTPGVRQMPVNIVTTLPGQLPSVPKPNSQLPSTYEPAEPIQAGSNVLPFVLFLLGMGSLVNLFKTKTKQSDE